MLFIPVENHVCEHINPCIKLRELHVHIVFYIPLSTTCYQPTILVSNITENTKHLVVFYNKSWYKDLVIT